MLRFHNPILIMMVGRSGSSMVAGIFARHGVWVGTSMEGDDKNPKGYFENLHLKKAIRKWAGGHYFDKCPKFKPGWKEEVESILNDQGYKEGPWLYKHGATFHKVWDEFEPKFIKVKRHPKCIFDSFRRSKMMPNVLDSELKNIIKVQHEVMESIPGITIYPQDLIDGNYKDLERAFDYCGLELDQDIADKFIDKSYWHEAH